jgi:hypothetical protein
MAVVLALVAWRSSAGAAQVVTGRVLEADTRKPIAGARVTLRPVADTTVTGALAISRDDGGFSAHPRSVGRYLVEVARLGFRPQRRGPFDLQPDAPVELEIVLPIIPVTLDPVTVTAEINAGLLQRVGFYDRQRADFGQFITREQIESRRASRPTDLLRAIPGVGIVPDPRSPGKVRLQMRGTHLAQAGACAPRVFVDGLIAIRGDSRPVGRAGTAKDNEIANPFDGDPRTPEPSLDDMVNPDQIEAIEVYRSASQVPAEFGGAGIFTRCGVVVIWTRHGR